MSEPGAFVIVAIKATALPAPHNSDCCRKCSCIDGYLARYIKRNGSTAIRWVCEWCEDYQTAGDLPRTILGPVSREALPLRLNAVTDDELECVVCGQRAVEYHHLAPRSIFPHWPEIGAYFCKPHHDEWHTTMRAHGLRWPGDLTTAA